ncbi:MAG TPA: hypothetical protein VEC36_02765 [Patescibacteria group bacterium]|nr:hypothetical protein [Patescibacteria group bacterium]
MYKSKVSLKCKLAIIYHYCSIMKDRDVLEVLIAIAHAERNPMLSELVFLLNLELVEQLQTPGKNLNKTIKKYEVSEKGFRKIEELKATL